MTYVFVSHKSKPLVRAFLAGLLFMMAIHLLAHIPLWSVPVVAVIGLLLFIVTRIGRVRIMRTQDGAQIIIKKLRHSMTLKCPVRYQRWWDYSFNQGMDAFSGGKGGQVRATANDLNVFLKLTDVNGKEAVFTEYIGFDTRFPNECPYATHEVPGDQAVFRLQRADKLFGFFQRNLDREMFQGGE